MKSKRRQNTKTYIPSFSESLHVKWSYTPRISFNLATEGETNSNSNYHLLSKFFTYKSIFASAGLSTEGVKLCALLKFRFNFICVRQESWRHEYYDESVYNKSCEVMNNEDFDGFLLIARNFASAVFICLCLVAVQAVFIKKIVETY